MDIRGKNALIVGAGPGIGASLARLLVDQGASVAMAARNLTKLRALAAETGAVALEANASDPHSISRLFSEFEHSLGEIDIVVYNASAGRSQGSITEIHPEIVANTIAVSAYGGFLVTQQAARRMVRKGGGTILLSGATGSVVGFANSVPFAMGKFALRGLAQSAARELGPKGVHVAHVIIDGLVRSERRPDPADNPHSILDPDAIAQTYLHIMQQQRSAWTFEVDIRPSVERF